MNTFPKIIAVVLFVILTKISLAQVQPCPNGDLENNNTLGWNFFYGNHDANSNQVTLNQFPIPMTSYRQNVPFVPGGRVRIGSSTNVELIGQYREAINGNFSLKIGDNTAQNWSLPIFQTAQMASYTFAVNNLLDPATNRYILKFNYALSFDDTRSAENANQGARFQWFMTFPSATPGPTDPVVPNTSRTILPTDVNPDFQQGIGIVSVPNVVHYGFINWICQEYDLTQYAGQVLTIYFNTSSCTAGGHYAYAFIDGLCQGIKPVPSFTLNNSTFCLNSANPIAFDGSASTGELSYFIEIQECDVNMNVIPGSPMVNDWFVRQQAGQMDLRNWYVNVKGKQFKPNTYYKVKLAVSNPCNLWQESSKKIFIDATSSNAGADKILCCGNNSTAIIGNVGSPVIAGNTYNWTSTPAGFTATGVTSFTVSPTISTTYHLTVTDQSGCVATDDVDVLVIANQNPVINYGLPMTCNAGNCNAGQTQNKPTSCEIKLSVSLPDLGCNGNVNQANAAYWSAKYLANTTYLWNTGETTSSISVRPNISNYQVKVTTGCFSKTINYTVPAGSFLPSGYFNQPIPPISVQNPPNSWVNQNVFFSILEMGSNAPAQGVGPAYNAYRYSLKLTQISGPTPGAVYCQDVCSPTGFKNGDISFALVTMVNGLPQSNIRYGTYKWELTLWNCATPPTGQSSFVTQTLVPVCDEYKWKINWKVFGIEFHSGKYCSHTSMVYGNSQAVTGGTFVFGEPPH